MGKMSEPNKGLIYVLTCNSHDDEFFRELVRWQGLRCCCGNVGSKAEWERQGEFC